MIFTKTALAGATIIDVERREDARGYFGRLYCEREFREDEDYIYRQARKLGKKDQE